MTKDIISLKLIEYFAELLSWAKSKPAKSNYLYIVESLGPVVLGLKPSELLNVDKDPNIWGQFKGLISKIKAIETKEIREINNRRQIIFYHLEALDSILSSNSVYKFLTALGYPSKYSLEIYIEHLAQKIKTQSFPHEIGLFLGYPIKDVFGYMGIVPLNYVKTQGWRVYGEETLSDEVYYKYLSARKILKL